MLFLLVAAARQELSAIQPPQMFITSVTGTGNLSTWTDAGGFTGIAAGDAICQARAAYAGLFNAANFRAWLSDGSDDAYCRILGMSGRKSANCGGEIVAVGGWVRTDGVTFSGPLAQMTGPENYVYMPPRFDELGNTVSDRAFTGTKPDGTADVSTCQSWTSAAAGDLGADGYSSFTASFWTSFNFAADCSSALHLYCFETGRTWTPLPFTDTGRLAFVTSAVGIGNLGSWPEAGGTATGLAAGDAICRSLATTAGLPIPAGFTAYLSATGVPASGRFTYQGPWIRPDGALIASSLAELSVGTLATSMNQTEVGTYVSFYAWTGTTPSGGADIDRCLDWTSSSGADLGQSGKASAASSFWSSGGQLGCATPGGHLYCLADEPPPEILSDDFESGGTGRWSLTLP